MDKKDVNGQIDEVEAGPQAMEAAQAATGQTASDGAEAAGEAPPVTTTEAEERTEKLADELRQTKDRLLRQAAEFQNYRRRVDKERAEWTQRAQILAIEPMLTLLDDLRRSLDASEQVEQQEAPGPAYQALKEGVELVYTNFVDALKKLGVESIDAVGHPFDESVHEALMQMPAPEGTAPGIVVQEIQRGYRLGDRVLRHSKVIVAA